MIVPVLTSLDAVTTPYAFGCVEENASRFAVTQSARWDEVAVLLTRSFQGTFSHERPSSYSFFLTPEVYHFLFTTVNYGRGNKEVYQLRRWERGYTLGKRRAERGISSSKENRRALR
jgi:hypothetical protein